MRVAVLEHPSGLSAYIGEILDAWGLCAWSMIEPGALDELDPQRMPVLILPAGAASGDGSLCAAAVAYARGGGTVVAMLPSGELARAAGIEVATDKEPPLRLRLTGPPMAGLTGESLPVVGLASTWRVAEDAIVLGFLYRAGRYEGESPGIVRAGVGEGAVVALAFDLPRAVLMLRQGDPAHREERGRGDQPARPTQLACDLGPDEPGWIPYADLLGLLLVDLVEAAVPAPLPRLWHLPGGAAGILLYSGDEDSAEVAWNRTEFEAVTAAGGRMNMFLIPGNTHSTREDVAAYRRHHDVGPHPNIRALDGEPVAVRVAEMERQIGQFEEMYGVKARSLRNHCLAWAGYMEPVEAMARCGLGMEGNYFCSTFLRGRDYAPYAAFGAAMPLRFCHPGGDLLDVCQQHTHTMDDVYFGPQWVEYSYRMSPSQWEAVLARVLDDVVGRFHVPHAVCIHPSNWVRFSREQGTALLRQAGERHMPIWSFDQWLAFCETRRGWRCEATQWNGEELLRLELAGERKMEDLHLALPDDWRGRRLADVTVNGESIPGVRVRRHGRLVRLVSMGGTTTATVTARYTVAAGCADTESPSV